MISPYLAKIVIFFRKNTYVVLQVKRYHHWKLEIHGGDLHPGEVHWSKFGNNLLKLMVRTMTVGG